MDQRERSLPSAVLVVGVVLLVEDNNIYERLGYVQEQTPSVVDEEGRRDQEIDGAYTAAAHFLEGMRSLLGALRRTRKSKKNVVGISKNISI